MWSQTDTDKVPLTSSLFWDKHPGFLKPKPLYDWRFYLSRKLWSVRT